MQIDDEAIGGQEDIPTVGKSWERGFSGIFKRGDPKKQGGKQRKETARVMWYGPVDGMLVEEKKHFYQEKHENA